MRLDSQSTRLAGLHEMIWQSGCWLDVVQPVYTISHEVQLSCEYYSLIQYEMLPLNFDY